MSDKIDIMLNSGDNISLPSWALETTQKEVLNALIALGKSSQTDSKFDNTMRVLTEKMFKEIKTGNKDEKEKTKEQEKQHKESIEASKEVADRIKENKQALEDFKSKGPMSVMEKTIDNLESDMEFFGGALGVAAEKALLLGSVAAGAVASGLTFVGNALAGAGAQLNELTKSGVGFNSTLGGIDTSATQGIAKLGALGVGFEGAAQLIASSSRVVATQGFGRFTETMKFAADASEELGMSFDDSMETFGDALMRRQRSMDLGNVSQNALNKTVEGTIKAQRVYSQALGISSEELEAFVDSLTTNNGLLTSTLLTMNSGIRNQVMGGIEVFASGMAALGGQAGQGIAEAFTDAASAGAIGLSDEAVGYITALPSLAGPMNDYISSIQNGTLTQDEAKAMVTDLTMSLGNLSSQEKARIKSLAAIGDASAQQMAQAIAQFEQSENKIKELNKQFGTAFDMDTVQKGTNEFNKVLNQAKGAFSNAFYSLFADPEVTNAFMDGVKEILGVFGVGIDDMSGAAMGVGDMMKDVVKKVVPVIQSVMKSIKGFAEYIKKAFEDGGIMGVFKQLLGDAIGGVVKALIKYGIIFAGMMFAGRYAVELAKQTLLPQAKAFGLKMFQGGAGAAKDLMSRATTFIGGLFDKGNTSKLAGLVQKGAGAVQGAVSKVTQSKTGKNIAEKLGSFQKDGAKMTDKLATSVTGGGKSGGFLKSIADGVAKFGDNKVVKGAASLALLGGAVALAAIGLKKFNEVEFASVIKGTIAVGGLAALAQMLGKGSTAMIKGAAAVAILGASIIPMAFGLNLMKDVGIGTIGVLAAGLITLGIGAAALGLALPFILAGAVAIGALGLALIPFGIGLTFVAKSLPIFAEGIEGLAGISFANLLLAGPALISLAAGMLALSAGGLVSNLLDGLGSLFGGKSPFEKIAMVGQAAEPIVEMSKEMRNMGENVEAMNKGFDKIDGDAIGSEFLKIAMAVEALNKSISKINFGSILKLGAMKMLGATVSAPEEATAEATPTVQTAANALTGTTMPAPQLPTPGIGAGGPQINAFGPGVTPVTPIATPTPGAAVPMTNAGTTSVTTTTTSGTDDPVAQEMSTTPTVNQPSVTQAAAQTMSPEQEADTTTLADVNDTLMQLLDAQVTNNKTAKKQQRSIEGLEI